MNSEITIILERRTVLASLLVIALLLITAGTIFAVNADGNIIEFISAQYDSGTNATTFRYKVTSDSSPALSHWDLEFCWPQNLFHQPGADGDSDNDYTSVCDACGVFEVLAGSDGTLGTGDDVTRELLHCEISSEPCYETKEINEGGVLVEYLRLNSGYGDGEMRFVDIKLWGNVEVGDDLFLRTKNGNRGHPSNGVLTTDGIQGPSCDAGATPVTVSYFRAVDDGSSTRFEWSTETEVGNVGFNIYAETDKGLAQINEQLIPASSTDSLEPTDYEFEAKGVIGSAFRIEDVDVMGKGELHGPYDLGQAYGSRERLQPIDWKAIHAQRALNSVESSVSAEASYDLRTTPFEVVVNKSGILRLTYEDLVDQGADLSGVLGSNLALFNQGKPVPVYTSTKGPMGPGDYVEFHGEALDTLYTDANVYQLQDAPGAPHVKTNGGSVRRGRPSPDTVSYTQVFDENNKYQSGTPSDDPWYNKQVLAYTSPVAEEFTFELTDMVDGPTEIEIDLWGITNWPVEPDHHAVVKVNGEVIADLTFDGKVLQQIEATLPSGVLVSGTNKLTVELPGDMGVDWDVVQVDKWTVTYPRAFRAENDRLTFTAELPSDSFTVSNLSSSDVVIYREKGSRVERIPPHESTKDDDGTWSVTFAGARRQLPWTYHVSTVGALQTASLSPKRDHTDITSNQADYLIIAHPDFIDGVQPIADLHKAEGLKVETVNVEDVYDQFSHGIFTAEAIDDYVAYAHANKGTKYVLLVGSDTYDYRGYLGSGAISFIPSLYAETSQYVSFTPSDTLYADVDEDDVPDLSIGRFPVRTQAELDALVTKTLQYQAGGDYAQSALFVAGEDEPGGWFSLDSEIFTRDVPADWSVDRAYVSDVGSDTTRTTILDSINNGTGLVTFMGHSGPQQWGFPAIFKASDIGSLSNADKPTVMVQWGCWNSWYVSTTYDSLSQTLLVADDKGAAATLGATSLSFTNNETALGAKLFPYLFDGSTTIGEAVRLAKTELAQEHPGLLDVLIGWNLLGDPALRLQ